MKKTFTAGLLAGVFTTAFATAPVMAGEVRVDGFPPFDTHFDKQVPLFNESQPDITITYQMNDHGDHHKKLTTNLATQSGAGDIVIVDVSYVGAFINAGGFVNLSEEPYNAAQFEDGFVPYAWKQGQGTDGNQYGIPVDIGPGVMYYRRDALESVGGDIDSIISDWDSYIEYLWCLAIGSHAKLDGSRDRREMGRFRSAGRNLRFMGWLLSCDPHTIRKPCRSLGVHQVPDYSGTATG